MVREDEDELKQRRRHELLDAALELFSTRGYHQVSMDQIAGKAGVSKGTVYWYFDSKDDLLLGVIEREHGLIGERLNEMASADAPAIEKLLRMVDIGSWASPERDRLSSLVVSLMADPESELTKRVFERLRTNIERYSGIAAGLMREASGKEDFKGFSHFELALALGACMHGLMIRLHVCPELCDPARMSELVRELFITPLVNDSTPNGTVEEQQE